MKESREIHDIQKVVLRGYGELIINQGEVESLEIDADEELMDHIKTKVQDGVLRIDVVGDWLDRITTFFARGFESQRIIYYLTVKDLEELYVSGVAKVNMDTLSTAELTLRLNGAGEIEINLLNVGRLYAKLPGAGNIKLGGNAELQEVSVSGAGAYSSRKLESQSARVSITGVGKAIVWAVDDLDVSVSGLGSVEYYGKPRVKQSVTGLGNVTAKG